MENLDNVEKIALTFENDFYKCLMNNKLYKKYKNDVESKTLDFQKENYKLFNKYTEKQSELEAFEVQKALIFGFKSAFKLFHGILK